MFHSLLFIKFLPDFHFGFHEVTLKAATVIYVIVTVQKGLYDYCPFSIRPTSAGAMDSNCFPKAVFTYMPYMEVFPLQEILYKHG